MNKSNGILSQAMLIYDCTINKNTGYTPYELQFGREPNHIFSEENERLTFQQIEDLQLQHENKLDEARKSIREYQDSNIPSKSYTPIENNDLVLVRNFNAKSFEPQWKEPFPMVRHDKYITYYIRENTEVKQYHRSDIKLSFQVNKMNLIRVVPILLLLILQNHPIKGTEKYCTP